MKEEWKCDKQLQVGLGSLQEFDTVLLDVAEISPEPSFQGAIIWVWHHISHLGLGVWDTSTPFEVAIK
jgi:hypothetical protein